MTTSDPQAARPPAGPPNRPPAAAPPRTPGNGAAAPATPKPAVPKGEITLERLAEGLALLVRQQLEDREVRDAMRGQLDRAVGLINQLTEQFGDLRILLPEPERWCAPWLNDEGEVYCEGGYKLMRSPDSRKDSSKKEWTHPLPEGRAAYSWNPRMEKWVPAVWHNVYESQARRQPPPEGERTWPSKYDEQAR